MEKKIKNSNPSSKTNTYQVRKSPGTRNQSTQSALQLSSKKPPSPKK